MKRLIQIAVALLVIGMSSGCVFLKTTSMSNIKSIPIPDGLTDHEAIGGVVISTDVSRMPAKWTNKEKILGLAVKSVLVFPGAGMGDRYADGRWRIEEVRDNYAVLGYNSNQHYIRIKYQIQGKELVPEVLDTDNMTQFWGRMHKNGVMWVNRNIPIIREGMWQVKTIKVDAVEEEKEASGKTRKAEIVEGVEKDAAAKPITAS